MAIKKKTEVEKTSEEVLEKDLDLTAPIEKVDANELAEAKRIIAEAKALKGEGTRAEVFNGKTTYAVFTANQFGSHYIEHKDTEGKVIFKGPAYLVKAKVFAQIRNFDLRQM